MKSSRLLKVAKCEVENEILRRALAALNVHGEKTYRIYIERRYGGKSIKALCKEFKCGKSTVYQRLKEAKELLLEFIDEDPWALAREKEESLNKKFPRVR